MSCVAGVPQVHQFSRSHTAATHLSQQASQKLLTADCRDITMTPSQLKNTVYEEKQDMVDTKNLFSMKQYVW